MTAEMPLPIFGVMSDAPLAVTTRQMALFQEKAQELGIAFPNVFLTLNTMTGAANPFLRVHEEGLVDLRTGARPDLFEPPGA